MDEVTNPGNTLQERVCYSHVCNLCCYFIYLLLCFQELLFENVGDLADKGLFTVSLIVIKHLFKG